MCSLSGTKPPLPSSKRLQPSTMERLIIVIPKYRHYYSHPPTIPQITFLLIIASSQDKWTEKFGCNPAPIPRLGRTFRTPSQRVKLQQEGYRGFLPNLGTSIARDIAQVPIILVIARRPLVPIILVIARRPLVPEEQKLVLLKSSMNCNLIINSWINGT